MHQLFSFVAALATTVPLAAQTLAFTTPSGWDTTEGNAAFFHWTSSRRMLVVDNTNRTAVAPALKQVAFRRDGSGGGTGSAARMFNVEFSVGYHVWGNLSCNFDANYKPTTKQTIYTLKPTNVPDWTMAPAPAPGPWDLVLMFDTQFTYLPIDALLWDLVIQAAPGSGSMDRHYVAYANSGSLGSTLGPGCLTVGQTTPAALSMSCVHNGTAGIALRASLSFAAATAPAYLALDAVPTNVQLPGLCGTIYVNPVLVLALGLTSTGGSLTAPEIRVPPNPLLVGATLHGQGWVIDNSQQFLPLLVTEGRTASIPIAPAPGIECAYLWMTLPATDATSAFPGGAPLARFSN